MSQVYSNTAVNTAASRGGNGSAGLFVERDTVKIDRHFIQSTTSDTFEVLDNESYNRCVVKAPLSTRGWVFQERFLAARTLHFTNEQLFCECRSGMISEVMPEGIQRAQMLRFKFPNDRDDTQSWFQAVVLYSHTNLTYGMDKLVAFSGIAQHFQDIFKDQYVGGLWRRDIERLLCWRVTSYRKVMKSNAYRAPSLTQT
ncbi:hypothetical protein BDZ45DRAFT_784932 [Acephala macrosclerotiorum]|nr:hypothetical protein BDZ45DRAFT_784932 [Acephala macrosclerotiorum]